MVNHTLTNSHSQKPRTAGHISSEQPLHAAHLLPPTQHMEHPLKRSLHILLRRLAKPHLTLEPYRAPRAVRGAVEERVLERLRQPAERLPVAVEHTDGLGRHDVDVQAELLEVRDVLGRGGEERPQAREEALLVLFGVEVAQVVELEPEREAAQVRVPLKGI